VPNNDTSQELTQPPPSLRGPMCPDLSQWPRRRALGWSSAAVNRWGGAWSGLSIRPLLAGLRADVDTIATASTKPLH